MTCKELRITWVFHQNRERSSGDSRERLRNSRKSYSPYRPETDRGGISRDEVMERDVRRPRQSKKGDIEREKNSRKGARDAKVWSKDGKKRSN